MTLSSLALAFALGAVSGAAGTERTPSPWSTGYGFGGMTCGAASAALPDLPSNYYGIELIPTKRVPGTGAGTGLAVVTFSSSPFGVAVDENGIYEVDVALGVRRIKQPKAGVLTAWATRDDLSETVRLGALDEGFRASGRVGWNKFLLVITLEREDSDADGWSGPVVMRGMSRSALMHTLAGHGPFEEEPCAKYGF